MASYGALPEAVRQHSPEVPDAGYGTVVAGIIAGTFYAVLTFVSEAVLFDTILSLGLMICFYYGLTAIGCVWYFRQRAVHQLQQHHLQVPVPAARRARAVVRLLRDDPGQRRPRVLGIVSIFGVGTVLVLGLGLILLGVVFMLIMRARQPAFFRGETLRRDTPSLIIPE